MTNSSENNVVYSAYIEFKTNKDLIDYINSMNELYKDRNDYIEYRHDNRNLHLYIKITRYKIWIKEPYFTLN